MTDTRTIARRICRVVNSNPPSDFHYFDLNGRLVALTSGVLDIKPTTFRYMCRGQYPTSLSIATMVKLINAAPTYVLENENV